MMCELDIKSYHVFRPSDNNGKPEMKNENVIHINIICKDQSNYLDIQIRNAFLLYTFQVFLNWKYVIIR